MSPSLRDWSWRVANLDLHETAQDFVGGVLFRIGGDLDAIEARGGDALEPRCFPWLILGLLLTATSDPDPGFDIIHGDLLATTLRSQDVTW